ncbi:MAG TPA: glycosyltransferase family 39 protein [Ohtaekwangia sp.]|uniref:ArnT family glycosyltransferase n=1 Tax=Ohtaekwangia sp. TaxID=2066019 RepID=UPI002F94F783
MNIPSPTRTENWIIVASALFVFLLHLIVNLNGGYGFFRDELYYIACSDHLAWGYVDQPPFSIFLLKIWRLLFGDSLVSIRMIPALAHTGTVVLAGLLTRQMGGKAFAVFLACWCVVFSLIHLGMSGVYSMNAIDIFLWTLAMYFVLKLIHTPRPGYWIALGAVLGVGLLNKISVLFLGAGIFTGIVFTHRAWFSSRWLYIAGIIALVIFVPYIFWNLNHDNAHLEFIHNASAGKYSGRSRLQFVVEQILYLNPLSAPVWITGLLALFFYKPLQSYGIFGWLYLTAFIILVINPTSKGEYLAPGYACLLAAAGIYIEQKFTMPSVRWLRMVYPALIAVSSVVLLPMILPVLPVEQYIVYAKKIGMEPSSSENKELAELPQFYADMFGWEEKARDVAKVYNSLSEEDKEKCAIVSSNYGRCGAIDFYGAKYGLPKSIGTHNNYWIWGTRNYTGEVVMILGGTMEDHVNDFESVEEVGVSSCTYCMPYENHVRIFLCRKLKYPIATSWKYEKHYE